MRVAVVLVAAACAAVLLLGGGAEGFQQTPAPLDPELACDFVLREMKGGEWVCPAGTADTGRTWGMADGEKQCRGRCRPAEPVNPACTYGMREYVDKVWRCPAGQTDTGRTWGMNSPEKQCRISCGTEPGIALDNAD